MWGLIQLAGVEQLGTLPIICLQGATVIGIFSVLLILSSKNKKLQKDYKLHYGLTFGITGFLLTLFVAQFIQVPAKPYLRSVMLFLAAMLGGWSGGGICFVFMVMARLMFGGWAGMAISVIDLLLVAFAGVGMHGWFQKKTLAKLNIDDFFVVGVIYTTVIIVSMLVILVLGVAEQKVVADLIVLRVYGSAISLVVMGAVFGLLRRETQQRQTQERELELTRTDPLTGLPNRRALREYLDRLLQDSANSSHTLVLIEVANLVNLVLVHGHDWMDRFWRDLERLLSEGRQCELLAPYRPRLFLFSDLTLALVLHEVDLALVKRTELIVNLHDELNQRLSSATSGPMVRLRYGVTDVSSDKSSDTNVVLRNLSLALQGEGQTVRYFQESLAEKIAYDEDLRQLMMQWILTSAPPLQYQPKCDIRTAKIVGAEALLRVRHDGQAVPPYRILDIATRQQQLAEFEWCTIETVIRDAKRMRETGFPLPLAVNVSAASLEVAGFGRRVVDLLSAFALPRELLSIEVTEASPLTDNQTVRDNLTRLHGAGIRLALDDFGTGYSALTILAEFPFNEVKIDYSMVTRLEQPRMQAAISLAYESASRYNAELVAEGVETETQARILTSLGIEFGQGYLYSAAIPLDDLISRMRQQAGMDMQILTVV